MKKFKTVALRQPKVENESDRRQSISTKPAFITILVSPRRETRPSWRLFSWKLPVTFQRPFPTTGFPCLIVKRSNQLIDAFPPVLEVAPTRCPVNPLRKPSLSCERTRDKSSKRVYDGPRLGQPRDWPRLRITLLRTRQDDANQARTRHSSWCIGSSFFLPGPRSMNIPLARLRRDRRQKRGCLRSYRVLSPLVNFDFQLTTCRSRSKDEPV